MVSTVYTYTLVQLYCKYAINTQYKCINIYKEDQAASSRTLQVTIVTARVSAEKLWEFSMLIFTPVKSNIVY